MKRPFPGQVLLHGGFVALVLLADQITKAWARARFSLPGGSPDYGEHIAVIGDWLHFRLVYNYGAAFGLQPQKILPFLDPVVFFVALSGMAVILLGLYYRRLGPAFGVERAGIALVAAGAAGNNFIDRPLLGRVTDFIDIGIPGVDPRFPVFNIADMSVCSGLGLLVFSTLFTRGPQASPDGGAQASIPENPHAD
jgi:signal peptidase II